MYLKNVKILNFLPTFFIVLFLLIIWHLTNYEIILTSDGAFYSDLSKILINEFFNPYSFIKSVEVNNSNFFYLGCIYYFAFLYGLFEHNWQIFFILLNIASISLIFYLIHKVNRNINIISLIVFISVFLLFYEYYFWFKYTLIDLINSLFIFILFKYSVCSKFNLNKLLFFSIFLIILFFIRPANIIFSTLIFFIAFINMNIFIQIKYKKLIFLSLTLIIFILSYSFIIFLYLYYSDFFEKTYLSRIFTHLSNAVIVHDRQETYLVNNNNFKSFLIIYFVKFIYFFTMFSQSFSNQHIFLNILVFTLIYLSIFSALIFYNQDSDYNKNLIFYSCMFILVNAHLCAITFIDYDWRYRMPSYPLFLLLSFLGINNFFRYFNYGK